MYCEGASTSAEGTTDSENSYDSTEDADASRSPTSGAGAPVRAAGSASVSVGGRGGHKAAAAAKASNPSRQAANQRERRRMRSINEAFDFLRQHVPQTHCQKKLSKVDTLRFAIDYIRQLDEVIRQDAEAKAQINVDASGSRLFIKCHGSGYATADGFSPVSGLELSWRDDKQRFGTERAHGGGAGAGVGGRTCVAKIWTPAEPGKSCSTASVRYGCHGAGEGLGGGDSAAHCLAGGEDDDDGGFLESAFESSHHLESLLFAPALRRADAAPKVATSIAHSRTRSRGPEAP